MDLCGFGCVRGVLQQHWCEIMVLFSGAAGGETCQAQCTHRTQGTAKKAPAHATNHPLMHRDKAAHDASPLVQEPVAQLRNVVGLSLAAILDITYIS